MRQQERRRQGTGLLAAGMDGSCGGLAHIGVGTQSADQLAPPQARDLLRRIEPAGQQSTLLAVVVGQLVCAVQGQQLPFQRRRVGHALQPRLSVLAHEGHDPVLSEFELRVRGEEAREIGLGGRRHGHLVLADASCQDRRSARRLDPAFQIGGVGLVPGLRGIALDIVGGAVGVDQFAPVFGDEVGQPRERLDAWLHLGTQTGTERLHQGLMLSCELRHGEHPFDMRPFHPVEAVGVELREVQRPCCASRSDQFGNDAPLLAVQREHKIVCRFAPLALRWGKEIVHRQMLWLG